MMILGAIVVHKRAASTTVRSTTMTYGGPTNNAFRNGTVIIVISCASNVTTSSTCDLPFNNRHHGRPFTPEGTFERPPRKPGPWTFRKHVSTRRPTRPRRRRTPHRARFAAWPLALLQFFGVRGRP